MNPSGDVVDKIDTGSTLEVSDIEITNNLISFVLEETRIEVPGNGTTGIQCF